MMKIELVKIEKFEADAKSDFDNQGGIVSLIVENKKVDVIIHPCGDMDLEVENDGELTDEEGEAVLDFINSEEEIYNAFPADEFE